MGLEIVILSEVSQRKKDILISYHLYVQSKKRNEFTYKLETVVDVENKFIITRE